MKVGFIFNHDAGHQAAHVGPVLTALAALRPNYELRAYVGGGAAVRDEILRSLPARAAQRVRFIDLMLPAGVGGLAQILDTAMPASRVARLRYHASQFADLDAIVAPERTTLFLKRYFGVTRPKYIHIRHGAGDRDIGFHRSFRHFDLLLLQGNKYVRRLRETGGLDRNDFSLIGYPKFDSVDPSAPRLKLFDNDNPVIFYNPHFAPGASSWNRMGHAVLDYFVANPDLNLIFSPHVMLFRKRVHIAPGHLRFSIRRDLKKDYAAFSNILVDLESPRQFDMTYTLNSDLYLADISSQVMEFLIRPRPCVFLNAYNIDWRDNDEFAAWNLGDVVDEIKNLGPVIRNALACPDRYRHRQEAHFADTFDMSATPSAKRGAEAIAAYLEEQS